MLNINIPCTPDEPLLHYRYVVILKFDFSYLDKSEIRLRKTVCEGYIIYEVVL